MEKFCQSMMPSLDDWVIVIAEPELAMLPEPATYWPPFGTDWERAIRAPASARIIAKPICIGKMWHTACFESGLQLRRPLWPRKRNR
jgi:hypothetical protein